MKIIKLNIEKINPALYNPRVELGPNNPDYIKLKKSILEFDSVEPLVWNKRTGNLVSGHQRLNVYKELKHKDIEVSVVDIDLHKEMALNLALNKISGCWDRPKLKDVLEEIDVGEFPDIEITGFDEEEIKDLMTEFHVESSNNEEEQEDIRIAKCTKVSCPECDHIFDIKGNEYKR